MGNSSSIELGGWRSWAVPVGLSVLGAFSVVILFSLGGQLIVAPALLPVQWLIARNSDGLLAGLFAVLGSALLFEVLLVGPSLVMGDGVGAAVVGVVLGSLGGVAFYRTSRDRG